MPDEIKAGLAIGLYWGVVALNLVMMILNIRLYCRLICERKKMISQRNYYLVLAERLDREIDNCAVMHEALQKRLFEQGIAKQAAFCRHDAAGHFSKEFYEYIEEKWRREDAEDDRAEDESQEREAD